tara:strand:+ start:429 stop:731 length:303 start_codon:yes stop_codon:yes gene_type:complete
MIMGLITERIKMKLRDLLQIQKIVEDRAIPYDVLKFDGKYHSQSKDEVIEILDLHLTHAIRILNNYLEGVYPRYSDRQEINDSLRGIRDRVEDISEVVNK